MLQFIFILYILIAVGFTIGMQDIIKPSKGFRAYMEFIVMFLLFPMFLSMLVTQALVRCAKK